LGLIDTVERKPVAAKMADEEQEAVQVEKDPLVLLTSVDEWKADRDDVSHVTAIAFVSQYDPYTAAAKQTLKEIASAPESAGIVFKLCNVDEHPAVAQEAGISALPAFYFLFSGVTLEHFCGNNMDKLRLCARAAELKKKDLLVRQEKEREEAARVAAEQAAAAATAAQAAEGSGAAEPAATA
jgi:thioredoxin-like negative regulator of GroEL